MTAIGHALTLLFLVALAVGLLILVGAFVESDADTVWPWQPEWRVRRARAKLQIEQMRQEVMFAVRERELELRERENALLDKQLAEAERKAP